MNYYLKAWKNFLNFRGTASRSEFWYFILVHMILSYLLAHASEFLGDYTLMNLYHVMVWIPILSASVRRMHELGKPGWFCLIPFYNIVLLVTPAGKVTNGSMINSSNSFARKTGKTPPPLSFPELVASTIMTLLIIPATSIGWWIYSLDVLNRPAGPEWAAIKYLFEGAIGGFALASLLWCYLIFRKSH